MKKKIVMLFMAVCMAAGVTACGSKAIEPLMDIEDKEVVQDSEVPEDNVTLGQYKGLEAEAPDLSVTEEEVETEIESILAQYAEYKDVTDRAVEEGDVANIDYSGSVDGELFEGGTGEAFDLEIGSGSFIPGFEEQIIGAEIGDNFDIDVTFPEGYQNEEMAGKEAVFNITVNSIQEKTEAELNEKFLKENTEHETEEDFRKEVKESLIEDKQSAAESQRKQDLLDMAMENTEVKVYPVSKLNAQLRYMDQMYIMYYGSSMEVIREQFVENGMATEEEFDQDAWDNGKSSVKLEMMVLAIAEEEGMEVPDDEYDEMLKEMMESFSYEEEKEFLDDFGEDFVKFYVLSNQVIELIEAEAVEV